MIELNSWSRCFAGVFDLETDADNISRWFSISSIVSFKASTILDPDLLADESGLDKSYFTFQTRINTFSSSKSVWNH